MDDRSSAEALNRALGRMEGKLDALMSTIAIQSSRQTEIEKRVTVVERFQSRITGMAVAAATIVSGGITLITKFIHVGGQP